MMNMRVKSVLFALAAIAAAPATTTTCAEQVPVVASNAVLSFVKDHKVAFIGAALWYIIDTRLNSRTRATFSMDDLQQDFKDLLNSLNIFDAKLYKQLVFLFDKYIIGLPLKLEDATKRYPKDEDGVTLAVKTKKLSQKPFGAYGLLDAYVLRNAKKFATETFTGVALMYAFFRYPVLAWNGALGSAEKTLNITISM